MKRWFYVLGAVAVAVVTSSCGANNLPSAAGGRSVAASHRTPPGGGFACGENFFTFTVRGGVVSGHVVESNVSTKAELPMDGSVSGDKISLNPLNGFGAFEGTLSGNSLDLKADSMNGPQPIQCSLTTKAAWSRLSYNLPPKGSRQLDTTDLLAELDLVYASNTGPLGGPGPYNPSLPALTAAAEGAAATQARHEDPASAPLPRLTFTAGPVSAPNAVSVSVNPDGFALVLATRAADGSCWYKEENQVFSTRSGVVASSCSADQPQPRLIPYEGV